MRRVYQAGIQDKHWALIQSIHTNSQSIIKWASFRSDPYDIELGVRQGGILSTDLYKVYLNPLLNRIQQSNLGLKIGNICCNSSACADDVTLNATGTLDTQILISMAEDFAQMERYILQPSKTELLMVSPKNRLACAKTNEDSFYIYNKEITKPEVSTHLGMKRATTLSRSAEETVGNNIQKARRTAYSLMASGLHGENGLDPPTALHLMKTYITPVLLYSLELIIPNAKLLDQLELFQKRLLKQVLSVPQNTANVAVYILSGFLPIEAQIHKKVLTLYNNVCRQDETAIEKIIARRQLTLKSSTSHSWFIQVKAILWKYQLGEAEELLEHPRPCARWKAEVNKAINSYWKKQILDTCPFYKSARNINTVLFEPGKIHPVLQIQIKSSKDIGRFPVKLKLLTGTYILQTNRAAFNQTAVKPTCNLCHSSEETLNHFILECPELANRRNSIISDIDHELLALQQNKLSDLIPSDRIKLILDPTHLLTWSTQKRSYIRQLTDLEAACKRLVFFLHNDRYRLLDSLRGRG